jgi:hypothetical protein
LALLVINELEVPDRRVELFCIGVRFMSERIARLRAHQSNIDRYEGLLRSTLSAIELRFVEQRLSEERLALAMLQFMSPSNSSKEDGLPDSRQ